jgi:hypothetical protein
MFLLFSQRATHKVAKRLSMVAGIGVKRQSSSSPSKSAIRSSSNISEGGALYTIN